MPRVPFIHCLDARRSVTVPDPTAPGGSRRVVFQRVGRGLGNVPGSPLRNLQVRRHVVPADPRTLAQQARRLHLKNAVAAWHLLTPEEKLAYVPDAKRRRITPFNQFISAWLKTAAPPATPPPFPYAIPYRLGIVFALGLRHAPQLPITAL